MAGNPYQTPACGRSALGEQLQAHGILPTAQRLDIAEVMFASRHHLSADQVLERVNLNGGAVSKATVYNTLGLFAVRGLVRELSVDAARVFYDSNTRPHCHFYNEDDGTLIDLEVPHTVMASLPAPPIGTYAARIDVVIRIRNGHPSAEDEANA